MGPECPGGELGRQQKRDRSIGRRNERDAAGEEWIARKEGDVGLLPVINGWHGTSIATRADIGVEARIPLQQALVGLFRMPLAGEQTQAQRLGQRDEQATNEGVPREWSRL